MPIYLIPLGGAAPMVAPPVTTATPPAFNLGATCEVNMVYPCLEASPLKAVWMVATSPCNCEDEDPEDRAFSACNECFVEYMDALEAQDQWQCEGCGMVFRPATTLVADAVKLP